MRGGPSRKIWLRGQRVRERLARRLACAGLLAALALGAAAAPAGAQAPTPGDEPASEVKRFQDWAVRCRPASEPDPRLCYMVQNIVTTEEKRRVLQVVVGRFGPERVLGALISVPIGVRLPPGIDLRIDDKPQRGFPLELCNPGSCQAQVRLDDELLQSFKSGLKGHVSFQDAAGRPVTISFSLKGFTAAFNELP